MSDDTASPLENAPERSPIDPRDLALRVAGAVGLGFSTLLLVDYSRPEAIFCSEHGGGCMTVRHSMYSHLGPISTPTAGVLYFTAILALSVLAAKSSNARPLMTVSPTGLVARVRALGARGALTALATVGALGAAGFLTIQAAVLHTFCKLCVVVDSSALLVGLFAWTLQRKTPSPAPSLARIRLDFATAALAIAAFFTPVLYGMSQPLPEHRPSDGANRPTPPEILREQREGVATIVEFLDFECPYCRRNQEALEPVVASYGNQVRIVRKHVPLSFHTHARDAARAACCAEEQGRGDRMADALFRADAETLTAEGCEQIAREAGLDMDAYRACLASTRPESRINRDNELAHQTGVSGLPTFWVGTERFEGPQTPQTLRASIDRALHPAARPGTPPSTPDASRSGT